MLCHHATFSYSNQNDQKMWQNSHMPDTLRRKKFDQNYTVSKYCHLLITQIIKDSLSKHFNSK